ncbi:MAG: hypothetical protein Q9187_004149 [Circinaria calcarea]
MDCLDHANPSLSILEIGAGTGGATRVAMKAFIGPHGIKRYADCTFTDISAGFLTSAQESTSEFHNIKFFVFNVEKDLQQQDMNQSTTWSWHHRSYIQRPAWIGLFGELPEVLKPCRKLVLVGSTRMRRLPGLLYGTLTGYWLGITDGRSEGPFVNPQTWDLRLQRVGFSGIELHLDDYPLPRLLYLFYTTSPRNLQRCGIPSKTAPFEGALVIASTNRRRGFPDSKNLMLDADDHRLKLFLHLARAASKAGFFKIDIDAEVFDTENDDFVRGIVDHEVALQGQGADDESEDQPWRRAATLESQGPVRAAFGDAGYSQLADYIEVKVGPLGLNLGLTSSRFDANSNNLLSEYAAVVTKTGADVASLSVGHGVRAFWQLHARAGCVCAEASAQRRSGRDDHNSSGLDDCIVFVQPCRPAQEEAKGPNPVSHRRSRIQLAWSKRAEVYAIVDTIEKARFLVDSMAITSLTLFPCGTLRPCSGLRA